MTADSHFDSTAAQRISAEGSSKVQLQLVLHSGPSVNFHFTGGDALPQRNRAKEKLQHLLPQFSIQVVCIVLFPSSAQLSVTWMTAAPAADAETHRCAVYLSIKHSYNLHG